MWLMGHPVNEVGVVLQDHDMHVMSDCVYGDSDQQLRITFELQWQTWELNLRPSTSICMSDF